MRWRRVCGRLAGALGAYLALVVGRFYREGPDGGDLDALFPMALTFPGHMLILPLVRGRGLGFGTFASLWFGLGALINCLIVLSIGLIAWSSAELVHRVMRREPRFGRPGRVTPSDHDKRRASLRSAR